MVSFSSEAATPAKGAIPTGIRRPKLMDYYSCVTVGKVV
jgi:hypothetical protein